MYKIFFEKRLFALCADEHEATLDENGIIAYSKDAGDIPLFVKEFHNNRNLDNFYLVCSDYEAGCSAFNAMFREINAGGGVVKNDDGKILMIFRRDKWDLPKGKQETGETIEACALREVEEETGLTGLIMGSLSCVTNHTYTIEDQPVLKHTYWFGMKCGMECTTVPQEEEQITAAVWLDEEGVKKATLNTYESIREVLKTV